MFGVAGLNLALPVNKRLTQDCFIVAGIKCEKVIGMINFEQADRFDPKLDFWSFIARPIVFMRPTYLAKSGWHEHVPFAFWLIEAQKPECVVELGCHFGVSYFAFCQAVRELELGTRCYGVDTWKGDAHAGFYDESVYQAVEIYNNRHYSGFSRLVRSTFDDALQHFSDGQIDLLHIDGHHSLESVRHDFQLWLPKLSDRAVVVFHDTNVRERGFEVYEFFNDLRKRYPTFEFLHGHGLGIVGVGSNFTRDIQALFDMGEESSDRLKMRELFSRMGRSCADAYWAENHTAQSEELKKTIQAQQKRAEEHEALVGVKNVEIQKERKSREEATASLLERAQQIEALRQKLAAAEAEFRSERAERDKISRALTDATKSCELLTGQIETKDAELQSLRAEREQISSLLANANKSFENARQQWELKGVEGRTELDQLRAAVARAETEINSFREVVTTKEVELQTLRSEQVKTLEAIAKEVEGLRQKASMSEEALASERESRESLLADLKQAHEDHTRLESELKSALDDQNQLKELLREATSKIASAEIESKNASNVSIQNEQELQQARRSIESLERRIVDLQARVNHASPDKSLEKRLKIAEAEIASLQGGLKDRFAEIVELTKIVRQREGELAQTQNVLKQEIGKFATFGTNWNVTLPLLNKWMEKRIAADLVKRGLLDPIWYLQVHADVAQAGMDPARHYIRYGVKEGREPNGRIANALSPNIIGD